METILHAYRFDISKPNEKTAYDALRAMLSGTMGLKCFETWGGGSHWMPTLDGHTLTLETESLFNNQWNTAPIGESKSGYRVFDWAQDYHSRDIGKNPLIKQGHWLEQTAEMREIRRNTNGCGYCGKQEAAAKGLVFCDKCLDSPYLKAAELHLLRMVAVDESDKKRAELTEAERAYLLPLYKAAQLHGSTERGKARIAKERADLEAEYLKTTAAAKTKRDGFLWLMNHGINTENCIYYSHTDRFSFGWRRPVDKEMESAILEVISEFPFSYEIKTEDGRKLEAA